MRSLDRKRELKKSECFPNLGDIGAVADLEEGCIMARREVYFEVLSLMDKALIRGANYFTPENALALRDEKARWMRMGGSPEEEQVIDQFLATVGMARGIQDE